MIFDYPSWYLIIVLSVLLYDFWLPLLVSDHCIVCPSALWLLITPLGIWSLYCLSFCFATFDYPSWYLIILLSVLIRYQEGVIKSRKAEGQTIQWSDTKRGNQKSQSRRTDNTMIRYQVLLCVFCLPLLVSDHCIVCPSALRLLITPSWYLIIVLSVLLLYDFWLPLFVSDHCMVCLSALCLLFTVVKQDRQYNDQIPRGVIKSRKAGQTIQ
jgi:hypothetical protein